jgi:1,2-dihydroxy-3-keto-5-methylthiopentene dioxygenase
MKACWLESGASLSREELAAQGILNQSLDVESPSCQLALNELRRQRGYLAQDLVSLREEMIAYEALCAKFIEEHSHADDEVRLVLTGSGIYEIRSRDDRWMRVGVQTGDLLVIPATRYHRFYLTAEKNIQCVRLFKSSSGWTPLYRKNRERESALA